MGNEQAAIKQGQGHGDLFHRGAAAAREGRYTVSELYFQQALRRHRGRAFWVAISANILGGNSKARKKMNRSATSEGDGDGGGGEGAAGEEGDGRKRRPRRLVLSPEEAAGVPCYYDDERDKLMLELPLDDEGLQPILDYIRLVTDITHEYLERRPDSRNCRIALVYCGYVCVHLQLFWFLLMVWCESHMEELLRVTKEVNEDNQREAYVSYVERHAAELTRGRSSRTVTTNSSHMETEMADELQLGAGDDEEERESAMGYPTEDDGTGGGKNPLKNVDGADCKRQAAAAADTSSDTDLLRDERKRAVAVPVPDHFRAGHFVTADQLHQLFDRLMEYLRYYYLTTATNYTFLVLLFTNELEATEVKRRHRILDNVVELVNKTQCDLINVIQQFPENELAQAVLREMPTTNYELMYREDTVSSASGSGIVGSPTATVNTTGGGSKGLSGGDSHGASMGQTIGYYAGLDGVSAGGGTASSLAGGQASTFLFVSRDFNLATPITISLTTNVGISLYVDATATVLRRPKARLATVQSAAERCTYYYCCWYMPMYFQYVPGHNTYFLTHALPDGRYTGPPGGPDSSLYLKPKAAGESGGAVMVNFLAKNAATALTHLTAYEETGRAWKKIQEENKRQQTPHVNPRLNLSDAQTIRVVGLEEAFALSAPLFAIAAKMLVSLGDQERAHQFLRFVDKASLALFGEGSAEHEQLRNLGRLYGL